VAVGASRSFADAPTAAIRRVAPPPRPSAAPDRPAGNGRATAVEVERRRSGWVPFSLLLVAAILAGYLGVRFFGPVRNIALADYTAQSASLAQQQLLAAGLQPDVRRETSSSVPVDRVIRQDPAPGTLLARNAVVALYVSSGAPPVTVPDVKGFTRADAEHALAGAKLKTKIVQRYDRSPKDTVLAVQPQVGGQAPEGSTVTLVISQGLQPVRVPQLVGLGLDEARSKLAKLGLKLNVDQETPSDMIPKDTIASQAVGADALADAGSTVGVTVSTGPMLTTVPDVGGRGVADASATLSAAGFTPRVQYIIDASNGNGSVAAQDPPAGTTAARRSAITISVAVAGVVPDVGGMSLDDAKRALTRAGYAVGAINASPDGPEGKVSRSDPEAGTSLRPGESVALTYHPAGAR
jgi:serine/threonine-protein kinase